MCVWVDGGERVVCVRVCVYTFGCLSGVCVCVCVCMLASIVCVCVCVCVNA